MAVNAKNWQEMKKPNSLEKKATPRSKAAEPAASDRKPPKRAQAEEAPAPAARKRAKKA